MSSEVSNEFYRGQHIKIVTTKHTDGAFTAFSTLPDGNALPATETHSTEAEARSQALSDAVAALDLARSHIGKP